MLGDVIEVAIGVVLVYLLISLLCTAITEAISAALRLRAKDLESGVKSLLSEPDGGGVFSQFFDHPLVQSLTPPGKNKFPSYMSSRVFSAALLDVSGVPAISKETRDALGERIELLSDQEARRSLESVCTSQTSQRLAWVEVLPAEQLRTTLAQLIANNDVAGVQQAIARMSGEEARNSLKSLLTRQESSEIRLLTDTLPHGDFRVDVLALATTGAINQWIESLPNEDLKRSLRSLLRGVGADLDQARKEMERWFDEAMQRVAGWYKRRAQVIVVLVAVPIIVALNADTLTVANSLLQSEALREAAGRLGERVAAESETPTNEQLETVRSGVSELNILGWRARSNDYQDPRETPDFGDAQSILIKFAGLAVTLAAVYQGSDFWFNALKKLVNIRSSGDPPPPPSSSVPARGA